MLTETKGKQQFLIESFAPEDESWIHPWRGESAGGEADKRDGDSGGRGESLQRRWRGVESLGGRGEAWRKPVSMLAVAPLTSATTTPSISIR